MRARSAPPPTRPALLCPKCVRCAVRSESPVARRVLGRVGHSGARPGARCGVIWWGWGHAMGSVRVRRATLGALGVIMILNLSGAGCSLP